MDILNCKPRELLLGTAVDNLSEAEILERIRVFLGEPRFHQIATVNPEFVLEAQKNPEFKKILNACDLNIADGVGIRFAFWRHGKRLKDRMTGADLMLEILGIAEKNNIPVFLAARADGLSTWQETKEAILKLYPKLDIAGDDVGVKNTKYQIPDTKYQILFCNFGAPRQELFINSVKSDKIRLAMGVGGSFDYLTGRVRRAPVFWRKLGLEWLWRLLIQPKRFKRIWNAVVVFPVKVIFSK